MALLLTLLSWSWWPLPSLPWLSSAAAWFTFVNAVVGAIAVMSTSGAQQAGASRRRLCRSGSSMVLDRFRSFFVFPAGQLPIDESCAAASDCCSRSRQAEAASLSASSTQLRASERNPQDVAATAGETAAITTAQPSAPVAVATTEVHAPPELPKAAKEEKDKADAVAEAEKEQDHDESITLDEAYALARRHRAKPAAASATAAPAALPTTTMDHKKKKPAKVAVDRRRVSKAGEAALEGKAELNARAELFIRQFREDLRLQRLNSILKHTHALGSPTPAR